jgi:hypothetical protein
MFFLRFHQFIERSMFCAACLFDIFHELNQFEMNIDDEIFYVFHVSKESSLDVSFDEVILAESALKEA